MRRSGVSKGGMCSSGSHYSLYCPFCGKPAFKAVINNQQEIYCHFTDKGVMYHIKDVNGEWSRKRTAPQGVTI